MAKALWGITEKHLDKAYSMGVNHKHGSAYSRTEPENAKTGCQDLSTSAR